MSEGITREVVIRREFEVKQLTLLGKEFRSVLDRKIEENDPENKRFLEAKRAEVNNLLMVLFNKPDPKQIEESRARLEKVILNKGYLGKHKLTPYPPNLKAVKRS